MVTSIKFHKTKQIFIVRAMTTTMYFPVNQQLTDLYSLFPYHVNQATVSPGISLEMQNLGVPCLSG